MVESLFLAIVVIAVLVAALLVARRSPSPKPLTVLICGAAGVGKSTLINVFCQADVARTGIGAPVTQNTVRIEALPRGLAFYDSKGLEVEDASRTYLLLMSDLLSLRYGLPTPQQIDLALMCIQEPQGRVDDAHLEIAALCEDLQVPLGVAITKTEGDAAFEAVTRDMLPGVAFVRRVRALELRLPGIVIPAEGVDELLADLRSAAAAPGRLQRVGALSRARARRVADAVRRLAVTGPAIDQAWTAFATHAAELLKIKQRRWKQMVAAIRKDIRRALVSGFVARNFLTKFDNARIDAAIMRRLFPLIVRRFADRTGALSAGDIATATSQATELMRQARPYRSRF